MYNLVTMKKSISPSVASVTFTSTETKQRISVVAEKLRSKELFSEKVASAKNHWLPFLHCPFNRSGKTAFLPHQYLFR